MLLHLSGLITSVASRQRYLGLLLRCVLYHTTVLVDSTEADMKAMLSFKRGNATAADRLDTFQHLMQQGEIRKAVTFLSEREETSGILDPQHTDDCSGLTVMEILETKHPKPDNTLSPADLPSCDKSLLAPLLQ